jgi:hypothetical protein
LRVAKAQKQIPEGNDRNKGKGENKVEANSRANVTKKSKGKYRLISSAEDDGCFDDCEQTAESLGEGCGGGALFVDGDELC